MKSRNKIGELVTNKLNRVYIRTTIYPDGELITGQEVDQWFESKLKQREAEVRGEIEKLRDQYLNGRGSMVGYWAVDEVLNSLNQNTK